MSPPAQVVFVWPSVTLGEIECLVLTLPFYTPYHCLLGISPKGYPGACVLVSRLLGLKHPLIGFGFLTSTQVRFVSKTLFIAWEALRRGSRNLRREAGSNLSAPIPKVVVAQGR